MFKILKWNFKQTIFMIHNLFKLVNLEILILLNVLLSQKKLTSMLKIFLFLLFDNILKLNL